MSEKMEVFIVRPFGTKKVKPKEGSAEVDFNFDAVDTNLITPALQALELVGGTTGKIFEPGDIREDMFSFLLLADIVIADITIHNANVFYELGIRHALRDRKTILLKCSGYADTPFDIVGFRYLEYEKDNPAKTLPALIQTLNDTIAENRQDSPVFKMLPKLTEQETEKFLSVPASFSEEVSIASASKQLGKLLLLAREAEFFPWQFPALRFIGEELFKLKALEAGRILWEKIKLKKPNDIQANDRLATFYQRLAEKEMKNNPDEATALLTKSDLAVQSLLDNYASLDVNKRAEAYSLKARNAKTRWVNSWKDSAQEKKQLDALQSLSLDNAYKNYESGYYENLNHFYSGINALALLVTKITLAEQQPETWSLLFNKDEEAIQELNELKEKRQKLAVSLEFSLQAEKRRLEAQNKTDIWVNITEADYQCLTSLKPPRVGQVYKQVLEGAGYFEVEAVTKQLRMYEQLNILSANVQAALGAIQPVEKIAAEPNKHFILFTGHMIDKKDRPEPRFPENKEAAVRQKIKDTLTQELTKITDTPIGIAGGACGGDILFHEVCGELGIRSELFLALPPDLFKAESVSFAGPGWIERFNKLNQNLTTRILGDSKEMPVWLQKKDDYTIWERNNLWELNSALVNGGINMTLIALWDGKGGDGAGGTEHMVKEAEAKGAKTIILDINTIG